MKTSIQLEWTDYLAAERLHRRPNRPASVLLGIIAVIAAVSLVAGVIQWIGGDFRFLSYIWFVYLFFGLLLLNHFILLPYNTRRNFQQSKELLQPIEIEVAPEGLRYTTVISETNRPWSHFSNWKENKQLLVLYITDNSIIILPKRAFAHSAELDQIRAHLNSIPRPTPPAWYHVRWWRIIYLLILFTAILVLLFQLRNSGAR